ncbi:MAG: N-6 DNA methylase, partial [Nitrospirae bacterium]|nr:N-6 DNA methylase [Nitrospirota bacterium]
EPDVAGRAYEFLIKKFADLSNKKAGEYYTPRSVISLMTKILKPQAGESVYDPACGTGGMLLEAFQYVQSHGGDIRLLRLFGQEKNLTTSSIARMNLILHGLEDFQIIRGDTLRQPKFVEADSLATFDIVIANPPFSLKQWGEDLWVNDPYGRNFAGVPPKSYGDYAWVQHMISSMAKPHGRMAVVLPQGALFRKGAEGRIRQKIIEMDLLEAVIGLGPNLFYGTTLAACILVLRRVKEEGRRNQVLFIDASEQYKSGRNQNELLDSHIEQIYSWYKSYTDIEGITKLAIIDEIREEDFNLNISLYVKPVVKEDSMTTEEALANLKNATDELSIAEAKFKKLLTNMEVL